jgi:hypothetical protein
MRAILAAAGVCLTLAACAPPQAKEYDYPAWGFGVSFQAPPKETDTPASADGSTPRKMVLESNAYGLDFAIQAMDISQVSVIPDQVISNALENEAANLNGTMASQNDVSTAGNPGIQGTINRTGQPPMVMRAYVIGSTLYTLAIVSARGASDPAVQAYLNSFHAIPTAPTQSGG